MPLHKDASIVVNSATMLRSALSHRRDALIVIGLVDNTSQIVVLTEKYALFVLLNRLELLDPHLDPLLSRLDLLDLIDADLQDLLIR